MLRVVKKYIPGTMKVKARVLQKQVASLGSKHQCPVCGTRVRAFEALPQFYSDNFERHGFPFKAEEAETCNDQSYSCPNCHASDRDRLYALYLRNHLIQFKSGKTVEIVDFAPSLPLSSFIRTLIAASDAEISYRTADLTAEGVDDKVDLMEMKLYQANRFDFFICSHVLEHVRDDRKAIRELYRILKPNGRGILMVPIVLSLEEIDEDPSVVDEGERWKRFGQFDHVRLYSRNGFLERVKEAGFRIHEYGREFFGDDVLTRTGICTQSVLYVVNK